MADIEHVIGNYGLTPVGSLPWGGGSNTEYLTFHNIFPFSSGCSDGCCVLQKVDAALQVCPR